MAFPLRSNLRMHLRMNLFRAACAGLVFIAAARLAAAGLGDQDAADEYFVKASAQFRAASERILKLVIVTPAFKTPPVGYEAALFALCHAAEMDLRLQRYEKAAEVTKVFLDRGLNESSTHRTL